MKYTSAYKQEEFKVITRQNDPSFSIVNIESQYDSRTELIFLWILQGNNSTTYAEKPPAA